MRWAALLVLLAGCVGINGPAAPTDEVPATATTWQVEADGCITTAVFFLVDFHHAARFLPPGFQPEDLSEFLYHTQVTSGKVPAYVAVSTCERFDLASETRRVASSLELTYLGFYVKQPDFSSGASANPADYNFYNVAYLGPETGPAAGPFNVTAAYGWRHEPAEVRLTTRGETVDPGDGYGSLGNGTPLPRQVDALLSAGSVSDDDGDLFRFDATGFFPQTFDAPPRLRFWHEAPDGVGFMEFDLPSKTVAAGPLGACALRDGTVIQDVAGRSGDDTLCGLTQSFALLFGEHALTGRLQHLPGVHGA